MRNIRLVARLDIKGPNLIKGIQLEGLRVMGDPHEFAKKYYAAGADEIFYLDIVASLYGRNNLHEIVSYTAQNIFIPCTVGGGIRSLEDVKTMLEAGADKVAINTAATRNPELIKAVSERYGSQCMVLSIEAKRAGEGKWEAYIDNGREKTGMDVVEWAKQGEQLGAGEILLTSVDREGGQAGFDVELVKAVTDSVSIPVIASGGMGNLDHLGEVVNTGNCDAVAMAHVLHYNKLELPEIRRYALDQQLPLRQI